MSNSRPLHQYTFNSWSDNYDLIFNSQLCMTQVNENKREICMIIQYWYYQYYGLGTGLPLKQIYERLIICCPLPLPSWFTIATQGRDSLEACDYAFYVFSSVWLTFYNCLHAAWELYWSMCWRGSMPRHWPVKLWEVCLQTKSTKQQNGPSLAMHLPWSACSKLILLTHRGASQDFRSPPAGVSTKLHQ